MQSARLHETYVVPVRPSFRQEALVSVHKGFIHLVLKQPPTLTVLKCVLMQDQHSSHGYDALFAVETHTGDWAW